MPVNQLNKTQLYLIVLQQGQLYECQMMKMKKPPEIKYFRGLKIIIKLFN